MLTYIFINLFINALQSATWEAYERCQSKFPDGGMQIHKECEQYFNISDGAAGIFYLFLGWVPAMAYVGFWELIWRIRYRKKLKPQNRSFRTHALSYLCMAVLIPVAVFVSAIIVGMAQIWVKSIG